MRKILSLIILFSFSANAQIPLDKACLNTSFDQEVYGHKDPQEVFDNLNKLNIEEDVSKYIQKPRVYGWKPWFRMKVPHLHPRTLGFYESIYFIHQYYKWENELGHDSASWLESSINFFSPTGLNRVLATTPHITEFISPEDLKIKLLSPRTEDETGLSEILAKDPKAIEKACLGISLFQSKQCAEAFKYVYLNLYNSGNTYHLGNGWITDYVLDNKLAAGGFKMVQRMLNRIRNENFDGNIFDDAYESFDSIEEADAFIFLSLVHGQITWESFSLANAIQPYNHATLISAYMMSILSAKLDSLKMNKLPLKQIYSLPQDVSNVCDNGKSYHYVVPWYISKQLSKLKYSSTISSRLSFYFDWTYQMFSKSFGRSWLKNINEPFDSNTNKSHRYDLTYTAIASLKGSNSPLISAIDFNQVVQSTENKVPQYFRKGFLFTEEDQKDPQAMAKVSSIFLMRLNFDQFKNILKE